MRTFDYHATAKALLTPEIVRMLAEIHRLRGAQGVHLGADTGDTLEALSEVARAQSVDASNRIEGISTTSARLAALMEERTEPRNRNEAELAGYRDVLALIHARYEYLRLTPSLILQLHRDMNRYGGTSNAGQWKSIDNLIAERGDDGQPVARFRPVAAVATPGAIEAICTEYRNTLAADLHDPLLLTCLFVFDFTCIHPFLDGNGRMSRLLTLLLMYQSGFTVGRYISIERLIHKTRDTYYEALQASSVGWHDGSNDYAPFVRYQLGVILAAYRDFADRAEEMLDESTSKTDRVEEMLSRYGGPVRKRDILERYPDISETTVERTLADLFKRGEITKVGAGPSTAYVPNATPVPNATDDME